MKTETLLPYVRVKTYDLKNNRDHCAADMAGAEKFIAASGSTSAGLG